MSDEQDLADQHKSGGVRGNVVPITDAARIAEEEKKRLRTERQLMEDAAKAALAPKPEAFTFGHYAIDAQTGGIKPGFVWVFGAETSWGKSSFAVMIADENLKKNKRVLIVSSEDVAQLYGDRLLCRRARVDATRLRDGKLSAAERDAVAKTVREAKDTPVYLSSIGKSIEWAAKEVRKLVKLEGIGLVMWDYIQAFDNQKSQPDRRNQITYISRVMSDVTKNADAAGMIFSQVTMKDGKLIPDKYSMRESQDLANAAEGAATGYFAPKDGIVMTNKHGENVAVVAGGARGVFVDKAKGGEPKRHHEMDWDNNSACFNTVIDPVAQHYEELAGNEFDRYPDYPDEEN